MLEKLASNYILNVWINFYVVVLQLPFSKYMESLHIVCISRRLYILHLYWYNG